MESTHERALHPAYFPVGTRVGPWRVVGWRGRGVFGAVYRAVREGDESAGPVALKVAVHSEDPRFEREVELLSRIRHPSIPLLRDHGEWRSSEGNVHPYIAMEWLEGVRLYQWAAANNPASWQVLQVLAQLARALEATHAVNAVHRDVKGENILVRAEDGRAFLTDFGAGHYEGASRLTWWSVPQGTPAYRSFEAWQFAQRFGRNSDAYYTSRPADDLFALGVTAWRLVTGEYPPTAPGEGGVNLWSEEAAPRTLAALNPRLDPRLSVLILRMLSVHPEARGTARELAEELEEALEQVKSEAEPRRLTHAPRRVRALTGPVALAAVGLLLMLGSYEWIQRWEGDAAEGAWMVPDAGSADAGTKGLGDEVFSAPIGRTSEPLMARRGLGLELPREPLPGQMRPDGRGKCLRHLDVAIRGGCWTPIANTKSPCVADAYDYEGACYYPAFKAPRQPTSDVPSGG